MKFFVWGMPPVLILNEGDGMSAPIPVSSRAANIEYAIRDVVVPAVELEAQGHEILKLNIGDPSAYPGLPTPPHMVDAYVEAQWIFTILWFACCS